MVQLSQVPMTIEGAEKLRAELTNLKSVERPRIINAIAEARALGDLKENAEYHAAKEQQSFIEGRIQELELLLATAQIIEDNGKSKKTDAIQVGTKVTIKEGNFEAETFTIVGAAEANPREGKISNESPIGKAILGHKIGDTVKVETPGGTYNVKIIKVG